MGNKQVIEAKEGSTIKDVVQAIIHVNPRAWVAGMLILAIAALLIAGIFNIDPLRALLPTPMAFAPAREGESLIIVANFEDRSEGKYKGIDPAQYIFEELQRHAKQASLQIRVERLREGVNDNTVRAIGKKYACTLLIWGWYDALTITSRLEQIQTVRCSPTDDLKRLSLTEIDRFEFNITTDLPSQTSYLTLLTLGLERYGNRKYEDALSLLNSAISVASAPNVSVNPSEAYRARGSVYYATKKYAKALSDYEESIRLRPSYSGGYICLARAYSNRGDYRSAIALYNRLIEIEPDNATYYHDRGLSYAADGQKEQAQVDFDKAMKLFAEAIRSNPSDASSYRGRGFAYLSLGDLDNAIRDFTDALEINKDSAEAYRDRGYAYRLNNQFDLAIKDLGNAIKLDPKDVDAYTNRGLAYLSKDNLDAAIADFDIAIRVDAAYSPAYQNRGHAYLIRKEFDRAIADLTKALELDDSNYEAYRDRGFAFIAKGEIDRALDDFGEALERRPNYSIAYRDRGYAYLLSNKPNLAIADLNVAIDKDPNDADAFLNRGRAYKLKGDTAKAISDFKQVLALEKGDNWIRQGALAELKELEGTQ